MAMALDVKWTVGAAVDTQNGNLNVPIKRDSAVTMPADHKSSDFYTRER